MVQRIAILQRQLACKEGTSIGGEEVIVGAGNGENAIVCPEHLAKQDTVTI